jgi:hypothetical protein
MKCRENILLILLQVEVFPLNIVKDKDTFIHVACETGRCSLRHLIYTYIANYK